MVRIVRSRITGGVRNGSGWVELRSIWRAVAQFKTIVSCSGRLNPVIVPRNNPENPLVPPLRLSVDLSCLQMPLPKAIQAAASLGVEAVELEGRGPLAPGELSETGLRQIRKMLTDSRLRVAALRFRTRRGYYTLDELDRRIEATRQAMDLAHSLGASLVINHVGRVPASPDSPEWRLLVEVLQELGVQGHRRGALLVAETGSESGTEMARLLAALPEGTLGVDLNPGQLLVNGFSPIEAVAALGRSILHVHVTDAVGESLRATGELVAVGRGGVDYPAVLGALEERDYRGYFTLRALSSGNAWEEVRQSAEYLRRLH